METKVYRITDLPEPVRSESLAALGMTAEEYTAHMDGIEAEEKFLEEEARAGRRPLVERMHYDDIPMVVVVN